jgi:hypothetical protein
VILSGSSIRETAVAPRKASYFQTSTPCRLLYDLVAVACRKAI